MSLAVAADAVLWFAGAIMSSHIPRLWVPEMAHNATALTIADANRAHHLRDVMRLKAGSPVIVFNADAGEYEATIDSITKSSIGLAIGKQTRVAQASLPAIRIFFAPLKRQATEMLIEKATELGTTHFQPVLTAHTQVRTVNNDRLQAIAVDAAEQCSRLSVPHIGTPCDLHAIQSVLPEGVMLFAALENSRETVPLLGEAVRDITDCAVLIGPEGGFSPDEAAWLERQPFVRAVSLGDNILRAETAAMLAAGIMSLAKRNI